ncbi:MAG: protein-glutamate O-methyltransferase CheR [Nitratireductor sp.]|nr:protein-glutamate O-methyltransferase CheR [Nitratireductor sp.]
MLAEENARPDPMLDPVFGEIRAFVVNATGNVRLSQNTSFLMEKVARRLQVRGMSSLQTYMGLLRDEVVGRAELDHLISELTIGETSFFRHREQFDALRDKVLPEVIDRNLVTKQLRIWSAGCSNGAEAYSIAIVLAPLLDTVLRDWDVTILGTDINRAFLAEAERGSYSSWILRNFSDDQLPLYFRREGHAWSIRERYRRKARFAWENLLQGEAAFSGHRSPFDIIFCRNVMIYFDSDNNQRLTQALAGALGANGLLFVAPADVHQHLAANLANENQISPGIFRKRTETATHAGAAPQFPHALQANRATPADDKKGSGRNAVSPRDAVSLRDTGRRHIGAERKTVRVPAARPRRPVAAGSQKNGEAVLELETVIESANKGDWAQAVRQCEQLLATDKLNASAHYYHGLVLQYAGNTREAEKAWRRSIYLDHGFALAHYQLGLSRKEAGDRNGATKAFRNAFAALEGRDEDQPADTFDKVTVGDLRELSARQLGLVEGA